MLGIDPGLLHTGYAVISRLPAKFGTNSAERILPIRSGVITTSSKAPLAERLRQLTSTLQQVVTEVSINVVCMEQVFVKASLVNPGANMKLAMARGALIVAATSTLQSAANFHELAPRAVKFAVTGDGNAGKQQVRRALSHHLPQVDSAMPADESDALAIALAHVLLTPHHG